MLDTPDIVNIFGKFIARADVDACLPDQVVFIYELELTIFSLSQKS